MENPYETPRAEPRSGQANPRRNSIVRGVFVGLLCGCAGYLILPVCTIGYEFFWLWSHIDLEYAVEELLNVKFGITPPPAACGLAFALAGMLNATPARGRGFVRCLLPVSLFAVAGVIASGVILPHQRFRGAPDPHIIARYGIAAAVPLIATLLMLQRELRKKAERAAQPQ